jgi:hypothetical protein
MIIRLMVWPFAVALVALFAVAGMCITAYNAFNNSDQLGE